MRSYKDNWRRRLVQLGGGLGVPPPSKNGAQSLSRSGQGGKGKGLQQRLKRRRELESEVDSAKRLWDAGTDTPRVIRLEKINNILALLDLEAVLRFFIGYSGEEHNRIYVFRI